jgi:RimJ/RimL family protein N-acetyltransferase
MIRIRRLKVGESDLFKQMRLASLREAPYAFLSTYESALRRSTESWREQADNSAQGSDRATFVVFSDNVPVGIAAIYRSPDPPDCGEITQVWISPENRGKTISIELLDEVVNWAKENLFTEVVAKVIQGNDRALRFYQKYGFTVMQTENGDDANVIVLIRKVT